METRNTLNMASTDGKKSLSNIFRKMYILSALCSQATPAPYSLGSIVLCWCGLATSTACSLTGAQIFLLLQYLLQKLVQVWA